MTAEEIRELGHKAVYGESQLERALAASNLVKLAEQQLAQIEALQRDVLTLSKTVAERVVKNLLEQVQQC